MIPNLAEEITKHLCEGYMNHLDSLILEALKNKGLPTDIDFIKTNITIVRQEGNYFDHYWYHYGQGDAIRIISIEREPTITHETPDIISNNYKQIIEAKYY